MILRCQLIGVLLLAVLLPAKCLAVQAYTDDCRPKIDGLFAKHNANREKTKTLRMTGTLDDTVIKPKSRYLRTQLHYDYQQSGINRRVDLTYDLSRAENGSKYLQEGRTSYWANDGKRTLAYISGTGLASIVAEDSFDFQNAINWLDDAHRGKVARSHLNFIHWLMDVREALPNEKQIFSVALDQSLGRPLPAINYRMENAEASVIWHWVFDPQAGYEVVKVTDDERFPNGQIIVQRDAQYVTKEVAPGVFRVVSGKVAVTREETDGIITNEIVIKNVTVLANGPAIPDETFTFTGMGLKPGIKVGDLTSQPTKAEN